MKQGQDLIAKQAFTMKTPGSRGRAVSVKVGDKFVVTSPTHSNKTRCMIDRTKKAKINSGYMLDFEDITLFFDEVN